MAAQHTFALWTTLLTVVALAVAVFRLQRDGQRFVAWREHEARRRSDGRGVSDAEAHHNRVWTIRLVALAAAAGAFVILVLLLFATTALTHPWVMWPLYIVMILGAAVWGILRAEVR